MNDTPQATAAPRVLELAGNAGTAWAARLLADHGADVIKVEPPGGDPARHRGPFQGDVPDPERSALFHALNPNKRSVTFEPGDPALPSLIDWADILVVGLSPAEAGAAGLSAEQLRANRPGLVVLSITAFGMTGPYADYAATELIHANSGGWAALTPGTDPDPNKPPLKVFGHQCELMAGVNGAMVALATWRDAVRSGVGDFIDLSIQSYVASVIEVALPNWSYMQNLPLRYHSRRLIPWSIFQAADAPIFLICVEQDQWDRLVEFMGNPDWATVEMFSELRGRTDNPDLIHSLVGEFISQWKAADLFHEGQRRRICFAPVMSFKDLHESEHTRTRGFFQAVEHEATGHAEQLAAPVLTLNGRAPLRRPPPRLGEHAGDVEHLPAPATPRGTPVAAPRRPLEGIRVADLSWAWAGPFCTLNLAHLGAEVIRLESASRPDIYRRYMINPPEMTPDLNTSGVFNQWGQAKRSVSVNLRTEDGIAIVRDLVAESDVVVQNFATGVLDRLGLGYETLRAIKPDIILASVSGFGQSGPFARYIGYGPSSAPLTGLCDMTGYLGSGPDEIGLSMPDPTAGLTAAWAVVSALARRDATGEGDHLDISLWEATAVLAAEGWYDYVWNGVVSQRRGNRDIAMAPHGVFRCDGDGCDDDQAWVAIACRNDAEWAELARIIDPELANDASLTTLQGRKAQEDRLEGIVGQWAASRSPWAATHVLQSAGIPAFPSFTARDIVADEHLNARGFIERLPHPIVGVRDHSGIPWLNAVRPNGVRAPAPLMGADTDDVLTRILGRTADEIAALRASGALH